MILQQLNQSGSLPVTNYQYEENLQEQRRRIRLIQPRFMDRIKKDSSNRMNGINIYGADTGTLVSISLMNVCCVQLVG